VGSFSGLGTKRYINSGTRLKVKLNKNDLLGKALADGAAAAAAEARAAASGDMTAAGARRDKLAAKLEAAAATASAAAAKVRCCKLHSG